MNARRTVVIGWVLAAGVVGIAAARGWGQAVSQPEQAAARPTYQYVGVEQTVARIEVATGRIEILFQRNAPRTSLLSPQSRPWEWREVRVRDRGISPKKVRARDRRANRRTAPEEEPESEEGPVEQPSE